MFHQGSLQSGISLAIQEQKLVACLVVDEGAESATWEREWLQNGWISTLLAQRAVLLRIAAGSTEAGYLSAFCPVATAPTFVVIENGQLKEKLESGIGHDDFINRVRTLLGANPIPVASPPSPLPMQSPPAPPAPPSKTRSNEESRGKEKAASSPSTSEAAQVARDALRKRKQEEREELARIKARIEADKAERKAQAEARKAERAQERLASAAENEPSSAASAPASSRNTRSQAPEVHLNVRLFDGRRVRRTFARTCTLQQNVRPWIDSELAASVDSTQTQQPPYYFRQILAPLPSREVSAGEESETLGDIELAPSATLVLIPVKGYADAYTGGTSGVVGTVTGIVGGALGLAYNTLGYVGGALGSVVGLGTAAPSPTSENPGNDPPPAISTSQPETPGGSSIRVRTLADQRDMESRHELYNGNQLNFEPNDDDPGSK